STYSTNSPTASIYSQHEEANKQHEHPIHKQQSTQKNLTLILTRNKHTHQTIPLLPTTHQQQTTNQHTQTLKHHHNHHQHHHAQTTCADRIVTVRNRTISFLQQQPLYVQLSEADRRRHRVPINQR